MRSLCIDAHSRNNTVSHIRMSFAPDADARVTIVMTARERHSLAESAIEAVVSQTPRPYRFIYVDVALVYGVLSFLAVLAMARYLERGL